MTKIVLNVFKDADQGWHDWWHNFHDYYTGQGIDFDSFEEITKVLAEWNAVDIPDTSEFYFTSEQDYTMFMLRWS